MICFVDDCEYIPSKIIFCISAAHALCISQLDGRSRDVRGSAIAVEINRVDIASLI